MSINKLKSFAQRSSIFGVAVAVLAAVVLPSASVFADALNPLTQRSLLLTSSAPGFQNSDGSGNTDDNRNAATSINPAGEYYAPPGSGPNGQKTGQTFTFRVSTDSRDEPAGTGKGIQAFTFQYCVDAAGYCRAPGDNAAGVSNETSFPLKKSDLEVNYENAPVEGTDYTVTVNGVTSTGWSIATRNNEDPEHAQALTGKRNFITLTNTTAAKPNFNDQIIIKFNASDDNYITNPGSGSFFVKINTYDSVVTGDHVPGGTHNIDGGVTVANVMTDSIHITTKVLETMSFSVGTRNRDTVPVRCDPGETNVPAGCVSETATHGTCDPIQQINNNRLDLGNPSAEFSLSTGRAYDVNSYWRLSSNSSGGASVYYSGNTLANTVGDEISEIGPAADESTPGTEQFGLAFTNAGLASDTTGAGETGDTFAADFVAQLTADTEGRYKYPTLKLASGPDVFLQPEGAYADGNGEINEPSLNAGMSNPASFAFVKSSNTVPALIAQNNSMVISCATAKMRYIANIGADTPAGVYTTKINYLAAPQY